MDPTADLSPDEMERLRQASRNFVDVDRSRLERVVAIGESAECAGVVVELIALEIRSVGAILY